MFDPFELLQPYLQPAPLLVVISGPSGVGKDSVIQRLKAREFPFYFVVTTTDRPKRPSEIDGVDYDFVSTSKFEQMIANDEFIEHALVYDQYKGVPRTRVRQALANGKDVMMRLDVQGAATVKQRFPGIISIFLAPPSIDTLILRLKNRRADSPEEIEKRLEYALGEIERSSEFDYVVINEQNDLDKTVEQVWAIMKAEKCRTARQCLEI